MARKGRKDTIASNINEQGCTVTRCKLQHVWSVHGGFRTYISQDVRSQKGFGGRFSGGQCSQRRQRPTVGFSQRNNAEYK
ncbi:hypothetical protein Hanom_Chr15g01364191 [Helianthus anomalus]